MGIESISTIAPEAEERLLAGCLGSTAALMAVVGSGLRPEDFGSDVNEHIFRAMRTMMDRGQGVDSTTLTSELEASGKLDLIGGRGVIDRLNIVDPGSHGAHDYAQIVRDRSMRRSLFDATEQIANSIYSEPNIRDLIVKSENLLYRVADRLGGGAKSGMSAADLVQLYRTRQEETDRILFPFSSLNADARGRNRGSLNIWGGYTGDGKTVVGMQSALAAAEAGYRVGYFSLEMTEEELLYRLLAMCSGVGKDKIETGKMSLEEDGLVARAVHRISQLPLTTFHDPDYTPSEIRSKQMRESFDLIVVDYLQRFPWTDWKDIPAIAKQFKNIALSTKCSVDLLSQVKPSGAGYGENPFPPPSLDDTFGGRATVHEADNVFFVHRERVKEDGRWVRTNTGSLIIAKMRGGKGDGAYPLGFDERYISWKEPEDENVFHLPTTNT